jgi:hypothetical protein
MKVSSLRRLLLPFALLGALSCASIAAAQTVIGTPTWGAPDSPAPGTTLYRSFGWVFTGTGTCAIPGTWTYATDWTPTAGCGTTIQTRVQQACVASPGATPVQTGTVSCMALTKCGGSFAVANEGSIFCQIPDNTVVADNLCTGTKPTGPQSCTGGTSVSCADPVTAQTINNPITAGCALNYNWVQQGSCAGPGSWQYSAWSPATGCGTVTQTRSADCTGNLGAGGSVVCQGSDGTAVPDGYCAGTKPSGACDLSSTSCGAEGPTSQTLSLTNGCNGPSGLIGSTNSLTCQGRGSCGTVTVANGPNGHADGEYYYIESWVDDPAFSTSSPCDWGYSGQAFSSAMSCAISVSADGTQQAATQLNVGYQFCPSGNYNAATHACTASGGWGPELVQVVATINATGGTYAWTPGAWGTCTASDTGSWAYSSWTPTSGCGSVAQTRTAVCPSSGAGTQTRPLSCTYTDGTTVPSSYCTGAQPDTTQGCTIATSSCGPMGLTTQTSTLSDTCGGTSPTSPTNPSSGGGATTLTCTDPTCTGINNGAGVSLPNCTPDAANNVFCIVVPVLSPNQ